jgi:hypothetical protein
MAKAGEIAIYNDDTKFFKILTGLDQRHFHYLQIIFGRSISYYNKNFEQILVMVCLLMDRLDLRSAIWYIV